MLPKFILRKLNCSSNIQEHLEQKKVVHNTSFIYIVHRVRYVCRRASFLSCLSQQASKPAPPA